MGEADQGHKLVDVIFGKSVILEVRQVMIKDVVKLSGDGYHERKTSTWNTTHMSGKTS